MEMLLVGICLSVFGFAVAAAAFGAATRTHEEDPATQPEVEPVKAAQSARFFAMPIPVTATQPRIPIEALLLQIENHVRLEQAAAQSFIEYPNPAVLHSKTTSTLVN
jgi:hypothetical protein